jgi:hypothetical protein
VFSSNNPAQLATLKTELTTDPLAYGYAQAVDSDAKAALLNKLRDGTDGKAAISVKESAIDVQKVLEAIDVRDFVGDNATAGNAGTGLSRAWFESVTQYPTLRLLNDDGSNTRVLANLKRVLNDTNLSQTRLTALAARVGSRAEQLFGIGTVLSGNDVQSALLS